MDHANEIAQLEYDLGVLRGLADRLLDEGDELHYEAITAVVREKERRLARFELDQASLADDRRAR